MWSAQKNISNILNSIFVEQNIELFSVYEDEIKKNYQAKFFDNKPQSSAERDNVKKSTKEPISLFDKKLTRTLQTSVIEEAITLSDLLTMSEIMCVELLLEAEEQMQYFHGFNRGLTAILLYYDTKKICCNNLKMLTLARRGRTWVFNEALPNEITNFSSQIIETQLQDGLISKLLNQIEQYDWNTWEEQLLKVNGLGSLKHRKEVKSLFEEIRQTLAECIFNCACQAPLKFDDIVLIINFLKKHGEFTAQSKTSFDTTNLYLIMAILYCFDCNFIENKEENCIEVIEEFVKNDGVQKMYNELLKSDFEEWHVPGIKALLQFSYYVFLAVLNVGSAESENLVAQQLSAIQFEEDQRLIESAIEKHVFAFMSPAILKHERFQHEKYFIERIHNLMTEFIYRMPEKIKDLKLRSEEYFPTRSDDLNQSSSSFHGDYKNSNLLNMSSYNSYHHPVQNRLTKVENYHDFEDFLNLLSDLYSNDPLKLELCLNYWIADNHANTATDMVYQNLTQKQVSLFKFVRYFLSSDILSSSIYIAYINLLKGLSTGEESSEHCFLFLQNNAHFYDSSQNLKISFNHILSAFERYYEFFRIDLQQNQLNIQQQNLNNFNQPGGSMKTHHHHKTIAQNELQGLISVCKLVTQIVTYNEKIRMLLFDFQYGETNNISYSGFSFSENKIYNNQSCSFPTLMFGLLTCPIPTLLKGEIYKVISSMCLSKHIATNTWQLLENSQILQTSSYAQSYARSDIKLELEEIEAREENYPSLHSFLSLIKNLVSNSNIPDNLGLGLRAKNAIFGFQPYLQFLINSVFLKTFYRVYKNPQEKWELTNETLKIFDQILNRFTVERIQMLESQGSSSSQTGLFKTTLLSSPGYLLFYELTHDSPVLRMLFFILNEACSHLLEYNMKTNPLIEQSAFTCLKIILNIVQKQHHFIDLMKKCNLNIDQIGIEKFLMQINPKTNRTDYLLLIFRFIQFNSTLINHTSHVLSIFLQLSEYKMFSSQLLGLFLKSCTSISDQTELVHSFVQILEFDDLYEISENERILNYFKKVMEEIDHTVNNINQVEKGEKESNEEVRSECRLKGLKFILFYLRQPHPNLAHLLLGMDIKKPLTEQVFYNPGTKLNYTTGEGSTVVPRNCLHSIIRILNKLLKHPDSVSSLANSIDMSYEIVYTLCTNPLYNQEVLAYLRNEYDFIYKHLKMIPFNQEINEIPDSQQPSVKPCVYLQNCWVMNLACIEMQSLTANKQKVNLKKLTQLLIENTELTQKVKANTSLANKSTFLNQSTFLNSTNFEDSKYLFNTTNEKMMDKSAAKNNYNNKIFDILLISSFVQDSSEALNLNYFDPTLIEKVIETCTMKPDFTNMKLFDLDKIKSILMNEIGEANQTSSSKINLVMELKYILKNVYDRNQFKLEFFYKKKFLEAFKTLVESVVLLTPVDVFGLNLRYTFLISLIEKLFFKIQPDEVFSELTYPVASILFTLVKNLRDVIEQMTKLQITNESMKLFQKQQFFKISELFSKLIEYLLDSNLTSFNVRTFLYATILNFFMIFDIKLEDSDSKNIATLCNEFEDECIFKKLNKNYASLFKIICSDSCEGLLNLSTMMGFSLLNKIMEYDYEQKWLRYINSNGYLSCIINTISNTDNQLLEELFHSELKTDKIIYIFESKLAFFLSISKTNEGAQLLLKNDLVTKFLTCSVLSHRKKFERNIYQSQYSTYAIQLLHQYYKIFFPTLKLLISILSSLGQDNIKAKSEVCKFVLKFNDSFIHILTSRQMDLKMMEELKLVTCLLSKIAPFDSLLFDQTDSYEVIEYNSALTRIKKEFINLISIYFVPDQLKLIRRDIDKTHPNENNSKVVSSYLVSISLNLSTFLTSVLKNELCWSTIIFDTNIEYYDNSSSNYNINSKNINIGLLINFLKVTLENLEKNLDLDSDLVSKQRNINDLVELEKKQLITNYRLFEKMSDIEKSMYLKNIIRTKLKANKEDLKNYRSLIEKILLLAWRHIEFYFICFQNQGGSSSDGVKQDKITFEEFQKFKQNLNCALNPNLLKRLVELENKCSASTEKTNDFVNILVKRTQRLLHLTSS